MLDLIGLMARLLPSAKWPKIWCVLGPKYFIEIGPWKFKKIRHAYPHRYAIEEKLTSSHLIGSSWWGSSRQHYWQSHASRGGLFKQFRLDLISRRLKLKLNRRTKTDSVITTLQDKRASLRNARTAKMTRIHPMSQCHQKVCAANAKMCVSKLGLYCFQESTWWLL